MIVAECSLIALSVDIVLPYILGFSYGVYCGTLLSEETPSLRSRMGILLCVASS